MSGRPAIDDVFGFTDELGPAKVIAAERVGQAMTYRRFSVL